MISIVIVGFLLVVLPALAGAQVAYLAGRYDHGWLMIVAYTLAFSGVVAFVYLTLSGSLT